MVSQDYIHQVREALKPHNACPKCGSTEHNEVRNYDAMWGDGDLYCSKCDVKIRNWDRD